MDTSLILVGLFTNLLLSVGSGCWGYSDCKARHVSMEKNRPWRENDPIASFFGFFLLTLVLGLIGFLVAGLRYNALRTYSEKAAESKPAPATVDDLLKWKQLFDSGAITEAEFAAKKKDVIGRASQWVA